MAKNRYYGGYGGRYSRPRNTNSLLDFNEYNPEFIGRPIEAIESMARSQAANTRQLVDTASATDLALSNLDIHPDDEHIRLSQQQAFKEGIGSLSSLENKSMMGARIGRLATDFQKNKGLQRAVTGKRTYDEYRELQNDRYLKGDITKPQLDLAMGYGYQGVTQDNNGIYNTPSYKDPANIFDMQPILSNIVRNIPKDITQFAPQSNVNPQNPYEILNYLQTTKSSKDKDVLKDALIKGFDTDQRANDFINSQVEALQAQGIDIDAKALKLQMIQGHLASGGAEGVTTSVLQGNTSAIQTAAFKDYLKNQGTASTPWMFPGIEQSSYANGLLGTLSPNMQPGESTGSVIGDINKALKGSGSSYQAIGSVDDMPPDTRIKDAIVSLNTLNPQQQNVVNGFIKYGNININGVDIKSIDDINVDNYTEFYNQLSDYTGKNFSNRINTSMHSPYTKLKDGTDKADSTFGGHSFKDPSVMTDVLQNFNMYDLETGEVITDREEMRDYIIDLQGSADKLDIRAVAELDASNPIPESTNNMNFVNGTVYNFNGRNIALSTKFENKTKGMIDNYSAFAKHKPGVDIDMHADIFAPFNEDGKTFTGYTTHVQLEGENEASPHLTINVDDGNTTREATTEEYSKFAQYYNLNK